MEDTSLPRSLLPSEVGVRVHIQDPGSIPGLAFFFFPYFSYLACPIL